MNKQHRKVFPLVLLTSLIQTIWTQQVPVVEGTAATAGIAAVPTVAATSTGNAAAAGVAAAPAARANTGVMKPVAVHCITWNGKQVPVVEGTAATAGIAAAPTAAATSTGNAAAAGVAAAPAAGANPGVMKPVAVHFITWNGKRVPVVEGTAATAGIAAAPAVAATSGVVRSTVIRRPSRPTRRNGEKVPVVTDIAAAQGIVKSALIGLIMWNGEQVPVVEGYAAPRAIVVTPGVISGTATPAIAQPLPQPPTRPRGLRFISPAPASILDSTRSAEYAHSYITFQQPGGIATAGQYAAQQTSITNSAQSTAVTKANAQQTTYQSGESPANEMQDDMDSAIDTSLDESEGEDDQMAVAQGLANNVNAKMNTGAAAQVVKAQEEAEDSRAAGEGLIPGQAGANGANARGGIQAPGGMSGARQTSIMEDLEPASDGIENKAGTGRQTAYSDYSKSYQAIGELGNKLTENAEGSAENSNGGGIQASEGSAQGTGIENAVNAFQVSMNANSR